jgi:outer membrane biogenesis lipoprotein LolB
MFNFGKIQSAAVAAVAAVLLTAVTVAAAVGPARAAETQQAIYAAADLAGDANA